ncbi:hypothetical protein A6F68_01639 [Tsuneonella dongtanensis]|uniref:Uncharacterized protein n=1 Tax=Tsuneonella dongtanensis TaxID=692370 RepID=A0A1B2ADC0_9SPHN|nr:hypothetical protein [Tsuneonella dongtanensis]ANY20152.1 hypothetical protein A6F68_01639 [Tsuneonella dongtanensis]
MSRHLTREIVAEAATVRTELLHPVTVDRTFELPRGLYLSTVGLYLGFLAVMAFGMGSPELIIPMVIFAFFIVAGFAIPAIWTRMRPNNPAGPLDWNRFRSKGVMTATGRLSAGEATAQMLVLPVLIFAWGIVCVTIAALV